MHRFPSSYYSEKQSRDEDITLLLAYFRFLFILHFNFAQ